MAVSSKIIRVYVCTCDKCGKSQDVQPSDEIYIATCARWSQAELLKSNIRTETQ